MAHAHTRSRTFIYMLIPDSLFWVPPPPPSHKNKDAYLEQSRRGTKNKENLNYNRKHVSIILVPGSGGGRTENSKSHRKFEVSLGYVNMDTLLVICLWLSHIFPQMCYIVWKLCLPQKNSYRFRFPSQHTFFVFIYVCICMCACL